MWSVIHYKDYDLCLLLGYKIIKQGFVNLHCSCLLLVLVEELKLWFTLYPHTRYLCHSLNAHESLFIPQVFYYL